MTIFRVELCGREATITVNIPSGAGFKKKTLRAVDADSLWDGLRALDSIQHLEPEAQAEAYEIISKSSEREFIQVALERYLAAGGVIRKVSGRKQKLSKEEEDAVLDLLKDVDLTELAA